jgi:DNA ligase (NAD+)
MERNIFEKQRELNDRLNRYRDEYYNRNAPSVSDEVYDRLFDELKELEQETGIQMANSPTQTVGYPAVSRLEKTRHEIPLLSLDKTKSSMVLLNFMGEQQVMLMLKLDGLTVKLTYENGELLEAATRGDGDEGEIITHNTRAISGIPSHITYKERLVVTGEGFIRPSDFEELKTSLQDSSGKPYKNGRNLAAGSIRLMDAKTCQERRLVFMPFGVLEGFPHLTRKSDKLRELRALGFQPCKYLVTKQKLTLENVEAAISGGMLPADCPQTYCQTGSHRYFPAPGPERGEPGHHCPVFPQTAPTPRQDNADDMVQNSRTHPFPPAISASPLFVGKSFSPYRPEKSVLPIRQRHGKAPNQ